MTLELKNQIMNKAADTGKSVHLSASAGSGKTRALKERYLALLVRLERSGLGLDQAVAITFTDKAAAEIKERVMHDLTEDMLKTIIRGRQDLRISTIHSFCMNLLKRYPLEAGLPPDFGVLDSRDQAYKIQKAIEDTLEESDRVPEIMVPLIDFTADELFAIIEFLLSIRSRLNRMVIDSGGPEGLLTAIHADMGTKHVETELKILITSPDWRRSLQQMERTLGLQADGYANNKGKEHLLLSETKDADTAFRIFEALSTVYFTSEGNPRKNPYIAKKTFSGIRAEYEKVYRQIQELLGRFRSLHDRARSGREAGSLLRLFQSAEKKYQLSKLREGLLDFDDLEIYTYGLLQGIESPDILYWLDRKILHFLVDEFQDTSDIQWAILLKLTEEIFAGQGSDKRMQPTLFVVGDEKQSIYRFREANYRLIENVKQKMEKYVPLGSREILTLDRNFRSTPEVIETVNRIFTALWGAEYKPSDVDRTGHKGSAKLIEIQPPSKNDGPSGPTEADILAREIRGFIDDKTVIYEISPSSLLQGDAGRGWTEREAGYGDCAVLIQSRTKLKEYEAALQKEGIPYRVVGGIGFYEEDEIQSILNVLFFLWNRQDKLSLAAALKSPLFGLTERDIFDLMKDGGDMVRSLRRSYSEAGAHLDNWKRYASTEPLAGLIHRIIQDTGAYVRFGKRNAQALFNLDKLLDTAREFDRRGYTTLQDFVEWVKNIRETEQREATADMNLPGFQGAVSIMTVHKAKGLEFPIVFLPGMNQQPKSLSTGPLAIIEDADGGIRMAVRDGSSQVYGELWARERDELLREHQRLLYVAMTRARDHLVMIGALNGGRTPIKPDTWLDFLQRTIPAFLISSDDSVPHILQYAHPEWQAHIIPVNARAVQPSVPKGKKEECEIDTRTVLDNISPVSRSESPEWKKATDFVAQDKEDSIGPLIIEGGALAVSPLTRGSVLHRCLEEFAKAGSYDLNRIITEYPDLLSLRSDVLQLFISDVSAVLSAVLNREEIRWIFDLQSHAYSELPFLYKRGHALVSGIIDRVVIQENRGYVIDYKAIRIENDSILSSWVDHYRPQIQIYCEAVKGIFGLQNVEGSLLFLDSVRLELTTKV